MNVAQMTPDEQRRYAKSMALGTGYGMTVAQAAKHLGNTFGTPLASATALKNLLDYNSIEKRVYERIGDEIDALNTITMSLKIRVDSMPEDLREKILRELESHINTGSKFYQERHLKSFRSARESLATREQYISFSQYQTIVMALNHRQRTLALQFEDYVETSKKLTVFLGLGTD